MQLRSVFAVLAADVEEAMAYGRSTPTGFARRSLFRTYFVQIEGLTTQFRRAAEAIASERTTLLTAEDRVLLPDQKAYLNVRGVARKLESFQSTLPAILFSMRCFGKAHGLAFEPELGGVGYASFKKFVKLRNSLTHPKSASDLALSDEQAAFALEAAPAAGDALVQESFTASLNRVDVFGRHLGEMPIVLLGESVDEAVLFNRRVREVMTVFGLGDRTIGRFTPHDPRL